MFSAQNNTVSKNASSYWYWYYCIVIICSAQGRHGHTQRLPQRIWMPVKTQKHPTDLELSQSLTPAEPMLICRFSHLHPTLSLTVPMRQRIKVMPMLQVRKPGLKKLKCWFGQRYPKSHPTAEGDPFNFRSKALCSPGKDQVFLHLQAWGTLHPPRAQPPSPGQTHTVATSFSQV